MSGSHPHTKLSGCDLDITCSLETVLTSDKSVNFGSDECTEISFVLHQLIISSCFKHLVSEDFKKSVQETGSVSYLTHKK